MFRDVMKLALPLGITLCLTSACQTTKVEVPEVKPVDAVEIADPKKLAPIKFDRVGYKIKRGTPIGSYDPDFLGLTNCFGLGGNIFWNQGRVLARDLELSDLFFEELCAADFNVRGNPNKMFAQVASDRVEPAYLVGGQVEKIALNACRAGDFWTGRPLDKTKGKGR